ncbi:MAG TPA: polysaccharide deacetylase family protein [Solirubrobacteraceae bacterium]|nr:polysaccharide deacetylase family protein [Solirubrobacteraceae bacterium]
MPWPGAARAAVSITFDNLGEAAEIELGLRAAASPPGGHYSVTTALPIVLAMLADAGLRATFFVEGINVEIYPDALHTIADAGHELAYHAWCHEDWSTLSREAEIANLDRGLDALRALGLDVVGLRPPGGLLNAGSLELFASRGLRYCSPAGSAPGLDLVAVLPFAWAAVDVFHVLPAFAALRAHLTGSDEVGGPDAIHSALLASVDDALAAGTHTTLVLHTWMVELERDVLAEVLARIRRDVDRGDLWSAPCRDVAAWMLDRPARFTGPPTLDPTSWLRPA